MDGEEAKNSIIQIKAIKFLNVSKLGNNDSLKAGYYHLKFESFGLSLVDCFVLAAAEKTKNIHNRLPSKKSRKEN
ncbi:MAG: hypothetical protein QXG44_15300 [Candidatus Jordarchaeaceae archaeon]